MTRALGHQFLRLPFLRIFILDKKLNFVENMLYKLGVQKIVLFNVALDICFDFLFKYVINYIGFSETEKDLFGFLFLKDKSFPKHEFKEMGCTEILCKYHFRFSSSTLSFSTGLLEKFAFNKISDY